MPSRTTTLTAALGLVAAGVAAPALALTTQASVVPAGTAESSLTLLDLAVGGRTLTAGTVALRSSTVGGPSSAVTVTPLSVDGTAYGAQTLRPGAAATTLPAVRSRDLLPAGPASLTTPALELLSADGSGSSSRVRSGSLGSAEVLGLPLRVDGTVELGSAVDAAGALGQKSLVVEGLRLPSLADLLAALGLDLRTLPPSTLTTLTDRLDLTDGAITQARSALDQALAPVTGRLAETTAAVAAADDAVEAATTQVQVTTAAAVARVQALQAVRSDLSAALAGAGLPAPRLLGSVLEPVTTVVDPAVQPVATALDPVVQPVATTTTEVAPTAPSVLPTALPDLLPVAPPSPLPTALHTALPALDLALLPVLPQQIADLLALGATLEKAYADALAAVDAAEAQLAAARDLLRDADAALDGVLAPVRAQVDALVAAVTERLDATPLLSLDRLSVTTKAVSRGAGEGQQQAEVLDGTVVGLRVLGQDVLQQALGTRSASLRSAGAEVDAAIGALTGTVSQVLSDVPGLPELTVPAPQVELLTSWSGTRVEDGVGAATTLLRAVSVTLPAITLPTPTALPGALSGRSALVGERATHPVTLAVGTLRDVASFRAGAAAAPAAPGVPSAPEPVVPGAGSGALDPGTGLPVSGAPTAPSGPGLPSPAVPGSGPGVPTDRSTGTPTGASAPDGGPQTPLAGPVPQQLPRTGLPVGASALGALLAACGLLVLRRLPARD